MILTLKSQVNGYIVKQKLNARGGRLDKCLKNSRQSELTEAFSRAVARAIKKSGSQKELAAQTGIHQSRISDYVNSRYDFSNLTVGTLIRLFPKLDIIYNTHDGASADSDRLLEEMEKRIIANFRHLSLSDKIVLFEEISNFCRTKTGKK